MLSVRERIVEPAITFTLSYFKIDISIIFALVLINKHCLCLCLTSLLLTSYCISQIQRFVLGSYPKDEKARMAEVLTRSLTRQIATKTVIKMRTSTGVLVHDYW